MSVNQLEATLQAITHTLAKLEKEGCNDEKLLGELRKERDKLLNELNLNQILAVSLLLNELNLNQILKIG